MEYTYEYTIQINFKGLMKVPIEGKASQRFIFTHICFATISRLLHSYPIMLRTSSKASWEYAL